LADAVSKSSSPRWLATGQLHEIAIEITGDGSHLRLRAEQFLDQLAPSADPTVCSFRFALGPLDGHAEPTALTGVRTLVQFVNVTCTHDGIWSNFRAKDGSFLRADTRAGLAWGGVSSGLLQGRPALFNDLLMAPLMEMLKERGLYGLHAAALTRQDRGYIFPGDANSGKTTIALGLVRRRFGYLADDKVLLKREDGRVAALAFTHRFNIDPAISRFYPELARLDGIAPLPGTVKRPFDVSALYPNSFTRRCWPHAVIHVQPAPGSTSRIASISRTASFMRLSRQTILSFRRDRAEMHLQLLGDLVKNADSYLLENARGPEGSPDQLLDLVLRV
jgi:hypothetical protein